MDKKKQESNEKSGIIENEIRLLNEKISKIPFKDNKEKLISRMNKFFNMTLSID